MTSWEHRPSKTLGLLGPMSPKHGNLHRVGIPGRGTPSGGGGGLVVDDYLRSGLDPLSRGGAIGRFC
mgnify:CR=1 FL=1